MGEKGDRFRQLGDKSDEIEEIEEDMKVITQRKAAWLDKQPIMSHFDISKIYAKEFKTNLTVAKKSLFTNLKKYEIQGNDIPKVIKQMKLHRRTLKGDTKIKFTKGIDNLTDGYSHHLYKMVDSIYWIRKYRTPLNNMTCKEDDLIKLSLVEKEEDKRRIVDCLCKYWEQSINRRELPFNKEYATLSKGMSASKRQFSTILKQTLISSSPKEDIRKAILKSVCTNPGVSSREIHDSLPRKLFDRTSPQIISKLAKDENITNVNGSYYKINDDIKKNLWAYTAAFIDSDGYITMDRNHNPRVGLVATGDRGKAFMQEMHKSLGIGRLHLDQKSPQNTRPVNRLNFYSGSDITKLLTKCRPHFRMKGPNADLLLELIKIKKENKKEDWFSLRKEELFKLMKYHNHKDNFNFNWAEWGIDLDNIQKLEDNNKMGV